MADWRTRDWREVGGAQWAVADGAWCIPIRIAPSLKRPLVRQQTMHDNRLVQMMQRYTRGRAGNSTACANGVNTGRNSRDGAVGALRGLFCRG